MASLAMLSRGGDGLSRCFKSCIIPDIGIQSERAENTQRVGMMIGLKSDMIGEYKRLHRVVWPGILQTLTDNGLRNFTISLKEPENLLFGSFDYHGDDYAAAAARIAVDPVTGIGGSSPNHVKSRLIAANPANGGR